MLEIRGVQRAFAGVPVLLGIDLTINDGEIICLLGPSGCGKTTLLRIIAGLETSDSGTILLDDQDIQSVPTHQRGFGLMFQDFALFPHMNVAANVAFGLQMQNLPTSDQRVRIGQMLELVGLSGFDKRDVTHLSGGERQRVALARSLAPNPRLLMLDEPLGSLDAALREELIVELQSIIKKLHLTAIYVTHDQHEAFAIADRIAVMNAGHIEQFATPTDIYQRPSTAFVARFLGLDNIIPVTSNQGGLAFTPIGSFPISRSAQHLLLHTDFLKVVHANTPDSIPTAVTQSVFQGDSYRLTLRHSSGETLTVKYPSASVSAPQIGDMIAIQIVPNAIIPLSD